MSIPYFPKPMREYHLRAVWQSGAPIPELRSTLRATSFREANEIARAQIRLHIASFVVEAEEAGTDEGFAFLAQGKAALLPSVRELKWGRIIG
jgi:hypothetical protein